ncbi:MAG: hypothetical protein AMJ92_12870 [candidate division Zixibacteria bacterium SM23_81]|nr:MAG: hypothetical protein AMJ92_12870 [candidate division Zixibacteria bacterium SM23_81]
MVHRAMVIILVSIFLILISALPAMVWEGLAESSEHFAIFYRQEDAPIALNLLAFAEQEYQRVTGIIGHHPASPVQIYLANDPQEFRLLTLGRIPEWGIGAAVPHRGRIVLISPRHSVDRADLHQVLVHELCHVVLGQALGDARAPRWLDEGLAMYVSHEWKLDQSILVARVLLFDSLIPLDEIEALNSFDASKAHLAYTESFLAVAFILDRYGVDSLIKMIRELAHHGELDLAMRTSLGITEREFHLAWRDYVTRRFHWASALSNPFVLWMFIFSLFVLAFVLKRRHTRKVLDSWRLEESSWGTSSDESGERWSSP